MPADPSLPTPPSTFRIHLPSLRARGTAGAMTGGRQEDGSVPFGPAARSTTALLRQHCHRVTSTAASARGCPWPSAAAPCCVQKARARQPGRARLRAAAAAPLLRAPPAHRREAASEREVRFMAATESRGRAGTDRPPRVLAAGSARAARGGAAGLSRRPPSSPPRPAGAVLLHGEPAGRSGGPACRRQERLGQRRRQERLLRVLRGRPGA